MSTHEAAGTQLVPAKRKNLPNRTLRAFDNAKHIESLSRSARDLLAEISRFVAQDRPLETVFAHNTTIAARIGMSERTLYRQLKILRDHGLIEVEEQERKSRNGRFSVARIRLTMKAAILLGLIDAPDAVIMITPEDDKYSSLLNQDHTASPETPPAGPAENTPAAPVIHSPPSAKMAHGHTLTEPTISKSHPLPRAENGLPADLTWLTGNGLSRAGIFKLMGQARAKGKRLSDIVTVIRDYLQDVKGGRLYAYLAKLIDGPTDFAVAAATERRRLADAHTAKALANKVAVFKIRFRNVALTNPQQSRLYLIDERAAFVQVFGGAYPTTAPLNDPREWIERIESGRLVMATLETEQRLQGTV